MHKPIEFYPTHYKISQPSQRLFVLKVEPTHDDKTWPTEIIMNDLISIYIILPEKYGF